MNVLGTDKINTRDDRYPLTSGILLGMGLCGFFDGIILHQVLQWHHLVSSAGYPPNSITNLRINMFADGVFHVGTYAFVAAGVFYLWRSAFGQHGPWSGLRFVGSLLIGFGAFNLLEGTINHQFLGIHHVNEMVTKDFWIWWDLGFLFWGAAMLATGFTLVRWKPAADETVASDQHPWSCGEAAPAYVRDAGPAGMQSPPKDWDIVDQQSDESFHASDPPGNY